MPSAYIQTTISRTASFLSRAYRVDEVEDARNNSNSSWRLERRRQRRNDSSRGHSRQEKAQQVEQVIDKSQLQSWQKDQYDSRSVLQQPVTNQSSCRTILPFADSICEFGYLIHNQGSYVDLSEKAGLTWHM